MARTTDQLLAQLYRLLPPNFETLEPLLAGLAATLRQAEAAGDTLRPLATVMGAADKWLTLQGAGLGVYRSSGESDDSLRERIRYVEDRVTPTALLGLVNLLLAPDEAVLIEWFHQPYLDVDDDSGFWLDNDSAIVLGRPGSFVVLIPVQDGTGFESGDYLDVDFWLDISHLGDGPEPAIYSAIVSAVEQIRAAGTHWRLVLDPT